MEKETISVSRYLKSSGRQNLKKDLTELGKKKLVVFLEEKKLGPGGPLFLAKLSYREGRTVLSW